MKTEFLFIAGGEYTLIAIVLSYFVINLLASYAIVIDKTLGGFQKLLMVGMFWLLPFSVIILYPVHLAYKKSNSQVIRQSM